MSEILLSICIPTYNRAGYLEPCMRQFLQQMQPYGDRIELIVSDNCSNDHSAELVNGFITKGYPVKYIRNEKNIGVDANLLQCFEQSRGRYCWIFGDDDLLLDGKLAQVIPQLESDRFAMLYLGNYWYGEDIEKERPAGAKKEQLLVFEDNMAFLKKINIWVTFISAAIFKKELVSTNEAKDFLGTNLCQLLWILPAIFSSKAALYMDGYYLACKGNNTGGYGLFNTFGNNLNQIVSHLAAKKIIPGKAGHVLNHYFIKDFMPLYCIRYKQAKLNTFSDNQSPFPLMRKLYSRYFIYWLILYPIDVLPVYLSKKYYFGLKTLKLI